MMPDVPDQDDSLQKTIVRMLHRAAEFFGRVGDMVVVGSVWLAWRLFVVGVFVVVISLLPASIDGQMQRLAAWVASRFVLIVGVIGVLVLFPWFRGSIRHLVHETRMDRNAVSWAVVGAVLVWGAAKVPEAVFTWLGVAAHPTVYHGGGVVALAIAVLLFLVALGHPRPYVLSRGFLKDDKELLDRSMLAAEQVLVLDSLKTLLLHEPTIRSIGLYGRWGSGKSSIFAICRREIQHVDPNIIWVTFEPWRYTSQESLTLGFYETIGRQLERAIPGKQHSAAQLAEIADPLVRKHDSSGVLSVIIDAVKRWLHAGADQPETYISRLLEREGKRLIITIDDVERIYEPGHVFRTLQLAHFLKQSPFVTYVFISEKDKLQAVSPAGYKHQTAEYLEKFIEHELHVPSPGPMQLRTFLNGLLNTAQPHIPQEFQIQIASRLIADAESYRGIIKVFNQFIPGLEERFFSGGTYRVRLEDKYMLDHIMVKYSSLWMHIQRNRALYVGRTHTEAESTFLYGYSGQPALHQDRDEINSVVDELGLSPSRRNFVVGLLRDLFPQVDHALGGAEVRKLAEWQGERRVAHPDVLDLYYAHSQPQELYEQQTGMIAELLRLRDEPNHVDAFEATYRELQDDAVVDLLVRLREAVGALADERQARRVVRAALRAFVRWRGFMTHDQNEQLIKLVALCNDIGEREPEGEARDDKIQYLFYDLADYRPHPSVTLRILLYMQPQRDNAFYALKSYSGLVKLTSELLKTVDEYYLGETSTARIFGEGPEGEWRFIIYQWALSIAEPGNGINTTVSGARRRYRRVNDYLFKLFGTSDKLLYTVVKMQFYADDAYDARDRRQWRVAANIHPYDPRRLRRAVARACEGHTLSGEQKIELTAFLQRLDAYLTTDGQKSV